MPFSLSRFWRPGLTEKESLFNMSTKTTSKRRRQPLKSCKTVAELLKQWQITDPYFTLKQLHTDNAYKKIEHTLKGQKESIPEYFEYDECFNNVLRFVLVQRYKLCAIDKLPEVSQATKDYLASSSDGLEKPWNIFTLLNDWHILDQTDKASSLQKLLSIILDPKGGSDGDDSKFQSRCTYEAEIGYLYYEFGRKYFREAVICYSHAMRWIFSKLEKLEDDDESIFVHINVDPDKLLKIWCNIPDGDCMKKKMILWCFQWAMLHHKLLLKYNIQVLRHFYKDMVDAVFRNTCSLLLFVTKTNDKQFCGWAWAIIAETMKNNQLLGHENGPTVINKTPYDCLLKAKELSPEHPNVLYLVGRHFRQRANCLKDFRLAVSCLEKAATKCKSMHVLYHQLGLAYRSMWILDRNYAEAKLYNNNERRSSSHRPVGRKAKNKKKWTTNCRSDGQRCDDQCEDTNAFLKPRYQATYESLPRHYKRPDYYDKLRTSNPIERKQSEHQYLMKSYSYLCTANKKVHDTSARYLTDLARICISLRMDAEKYFTNAVRVIEDDDQTCSTDGAYLFEQWGLYMKSKDPNRAKELFLKSLRFSIMGNQRSRVAFYELIELLSKIRSADPESKRAVAKEKAFIFRLVGKYGQARDVIKAAACPASNMQLNDIIRRPENEELLWELICCYHAEGNNPLAFDYLMIYVKCFPEKPELDKAKVALDIAMNLMVSKENFSGEFPSVFRWVFSDFESDSEESSDEEIYDVLLLASDLNCPLTEKVTHGLKSLCGLKYFEASGSSCDLLSIGAPSIHAAFEWLYDNLSCFHLCLVGVDTDGFHENKEYKELQAGIRRNAHDQDKCLLMFTQDSQRHDALYLSSEDTSDVIMCRIIQKALDMLSSINEEEC